MFTTLFIILTAFMTLDTVTTYIGMKYCKGTELNPLWRWCNKQLGTLGTNLLMAGVKISVLAILWNIHIGVVLIVLIGGYVYLFTKYDNLKVFRCIR